MSSARSPRACSGSSSPPLREAMRAAAALEPLEAAKLIDCIAACFEWMADDGTIRIPDEIAAELYG